MEMIREYGVLKCVGRVLYGKVYKYIAPKYSASLTKKTMINPKKILFVSYPSFSDNAWFMYEYLHSVLDASYSFVWLASSNDRPKRLESRTTSVFYRTFYCPKYATYKALKEIATSKYIFFTHGSPNTWISPRNVYCKI
jgi:hypothetical protein